MNEKEIKNEDGINSRIDSFRHLASRITPAIKFEIPSLMMRFGNYQDICDYVSRIDRFRKVIYPYSIQAMEAIDPKFSQDMEFAKKAYAERIFLANNKDDYNPEIWKFIGNKKTFTEISESRKQVDDTLLAKKVEENPELLEKITELLKNGKK